MPDKNTTYLDGQMAFSDSKGDYDIVVGGDAPADSAIFRDEVKIYVNKKESKEFSVSSRLITDGLFDRQPSEKELSFVDGKIITNTDLCKNEYFDIVEQGIVTGKEHQTTLFECPKNGVVEYKIDTLNMDLIEQPPLTSEYKAGWDDRFNCEIDVDESNVIDTKTGNILVHRPANIVNSYALYNNQGKANRIINPFEGSDVNYFVGKFYHIDRYCAIKPDGSRVWLNSAYDKKTGIMTVRLPDELLRDESLFKAGLRIDPSFGYTTLGGSTTNGMASSTYIICNYTPYTGAAGTGDSLSIGGKGNNCKVKLAIYNTNTPRDYITNSASNEITFGSTKEWKTAAHASAPTYTAVNYLLTFIGDTNWENFGEVAYDSGGGGYYYQSGQTYGTWPATLTLTSQAADYIISSYATYTTGGATFKPFGRFIN